MFFQTKLIIKWLKFINLKINYQIFKGWLKNNENCFALENVNSQCLGQSFFLLFS